MITSLVEPGGARPGDATRRTVIVAMFAYTALAALVAAAANTGAGLGVIALGLLFIVLIDLRQWRDIVAHDRAHAPPEPPRAALPRREPQRAIAPPTPAVTQVFTTTRLLPFSNMAEPVLLEAGSNTSLAAERPVAEGSSHSFETTPVEPSTPVAGSLNETMVDSNLVEEERETAEKLAALPKNASAEEKANAVGARPTGLDAPHSGRADDLKRINGIGQVNEKKLNALGIYHFEQIAAWQRPEVRWVAAYLAFPGRIDREGWIEQAVRLAAEAKS